jgi:hypothetical protein
MTVPGRGCLSYEGIRAKDLAGEIVVTHSILSLNESTNIKKEPEHRAPPAKKGEAKSKMQNRLPRFFVDQAAKFASLSHVLI